MDLLVSPVSFISMMSFSASFPDMGAQCGTSSWLGEVPLSPWLLIFIFKFKKYFLPYGNGVHICNVSHVFLWSLAFPSIFLTVFQWEK